MKKYLLPQGGNYYKANLHCHSTVSDGHLSPLELKNLYKSMGYSIIAYTDHRIMVSHPELADEEFLPLNGFEINIDETGNLHSSLLKTCHMCLIALEPDNEKIVTWEKNRYTAEYVSEIMQRGRDSGFFVTYNHPAWSGESYEQYMNYHHMNALEILNHCGIYKGVEDYCPWVYDDMLRGGERIYCVAADDNHNSKRSRNRDSGGGWVMIKANQLEYRTITKALESGNFYASSGPEIHDLWIEDGQLHVTTSDAAQIRFGFGNRNAMRIWPEEGEDSLNYGSVKLDPHGIYVRVTVIDHRGRFAHSNAYFLDYIV